MKCKRLLCLFFSLLFLICSLFPLGTSAAGVINPMNSTDVIKDLVANDFILSEYPQDESANFVSLIQFLEFGYTAYKKFDFYSLYVYIYNPTGKAVSTTGSAIQMSYVDRTSSKVTFEKHPLVLVDASENSESGQYENLFLKFRIDNVGYVARNINELKRTYYFSGIELKYSDSSKVKDFALNETWSYTGYQENCDITGEGGCTLYATVDTIEVAKIELHDASWFSDTSDLGSNYRYELSSVYFNIPDYFINEYGDPNSATSGLYAVRGEYYKYLINGLLVNDRSLYDQLIQKVNFRDLLKDPQYSNGHTGEIGFAAYNNGYSPQYQVSFNKKITSLVGTKARIYRLQYPIYSPDLYVESSYMYDLYQANGKLHFNRDDELYLDNDHVKCGYKQYEIRVDQGLWNSSIKSYASTHNEWYHYVDAFFRGNLKLYADKQGYAAIDPIVELDSKSFDGSDSVIGDRLFVMEDQVDSLEAFYNAKKKDNHVYLMRFEVNPYYAPSVTVGKSTDTVAGYDDTNGIYFEKVVFENFDILEFEFHDSYGKETVIPVVCDPIDIVGAVTPGNNTVDQDPNKPGIQDGTEPIELEDMDWSWLWKILIGVGIACVILLVLNFLGVPIKPIVSFIFFVLSIPFRILIWIPKAIGKLFGFGKEVSEEKRKKEEHSWLRNEERRKQEAHEQGLQERASEQARKDERQSWDRQDREK